MGIKNFLMHSWNVFRNRDPTEKIKENYGYSYNIRPFQNVLNIQNERSIVASIYTKIAIDVSSMKIVHARLDENDRFIEVINSSLNECLTVSANIDQTGRAFIEDAVLTLLDEGAIAIVPVDTDIDPENSASFSIKSLRVGKIVEWFPEDVRVNLYNEKTGIREDVVVSKKYTAIIINPFYNVMNEPNSTFKRLVSKMNALDAIDKQSASGKLDIIIQLPYTIKSELSQQRAENRRKSIETQLENSKYGIAYIDATEHITQLNRPAENNLLQQIEYLTKLFYSQLGVTESVFNGEADEQTMLNYNNDTIEPIISALCEGMHRTFLTKTARTQRQAITFIRDPFRLVPVANIAEIADKFTRNEILSSNDVRAIIGYKPSEDPGADELRNKNLNRQNETGGSSLSAESLSNGESEEDSIVNELLDSLEAQINALVDNYISEEEE